MDQAQAGPTMSNDAWASGFVIVTATLAGVAIEITAIAHRRRDARRHRTDVEPIPWREMEHWQ